MSMAKPGLIINLSVPEGSNVYALVGRVCLLLSGHMLEHFLDDIRVALSPAATTGYEDILAIVDQYVNLEDSSGTYPDYTLHPEEDEN
jgi:hypothetical protein